MEGVSTNMFPFSKLRHDVFLTLEVLLYVERAHALEFIFGVNKETRAFLLKHFVSVKNGYINEGLIEYNMRCDFHSIQ